MTGYTDVTADTQLSPLSATQQAIYNAADAYGVDYGVLTQLAQSESGGNANYSGAGPNGTRYVGLFSVNTATAANPGYGVTPVSSAGLSDTQTNANFAAQYLSALLDKNGGDYNAAVTQYNLGRGSGATSLLQSQYAGQQNYGNLVSAVNDANEAHGITTTTGGSSAQAGVNAAASGVGSGGTAASEGVCPLGNIFGVSLCVVALVILGIVLIGAGVFMLGREAL